VPMLAIAVSLLILAGATRAQLLGGAAGLAAGAVLFIANDRILTRVGGVPYVEPVTLQTAHKSPAAHRRSAAE
jgi:hypothetical protein